MKLLRLIKHSDSSFSKSEEGKQCFNIFKVIHLKGNSAHFAYLSVFTGLLESYCMCETISTRRFVAPEEAACSRINCPR